MPSRQVFPQEWDPVIELDKVKGHLNFDFSVNKQHSLEAELQHAALATIHGKFPYDNWIYVCKDGSAKDAIKIAGAGGLFWHL